MDGVQAAIDAVQRSRPARDLRDVTTLYQDWAVAVYLDDEESDLWDIKAADFGDVDSDGWTIDIADDEFWDGRGSNQGAQPSSKWDKRKNGQAPTAVPYGIQVERFRNPGPIVNVSLDGDDSSQVAPHTGDTHWYAGYESQSDNVLDVDVTGEATSLDFWTWHFIEEGWDYGFVEALVGGEWVTVPLVDDSGADGDDGRRPARWQHRGQRPHRNLRRRVLRRRAGVRAPDGAAAGRNHGRAVPLLDRRGVPRHRLVRR